MKKQTLKGSCGKQFPSFWLKTWSCSQTGISCVRQSPLTFSSHFKANIHNSAVKVQTCGVGKNEGKIHNIHILRPRWRLTLIELQRQWKAGVWQASSLFNCSESNPSSVGIQRGSDPDRHTDAQTNLQTGRQTDTRTNLQRDRRTDSQTNLSINMCAVFNWQKSTFRNIQ